jgi:hypothetical protein
LSFPPAELMAEFAAEKQAVARKNAAATGLLMGVLAASAFAATQGLSRGRRRTMLTAPLSILVGGGAGVVAGWVSQLWLNHLLATAEPLTAVVLFQTAFWAILGAGLGAGTGLFAGSPGRFCVLLCQGLVAGAAFGLADATIAGFAFPVDDAEQLVPVSLVNRGIWSVVGISWLGLLLGASSRRRRVPAAV